MNQTRSDVAKVEKCLIKEASEEHLPECKESTKNGLVNGVVHHKKGKRHRRSKGDSKQENSLEKEETNISRNHHTNLEEAVDQKDQESEKHIENDHQSTSIVNNLDESLTDEEHQIPLNLESNHNIDQELDNLNCDLDIQRESDESTLHNHINAEDIETKNVSELSDKIQNINLEEKPNENCDKKIDFVQYESELQMPMIMRIIQKDLSEPYSIYTYRYFIHNWPKLCFLAMCEGQCVGAIVCKLDVHRKVIRRGYIAMLAVDQNYRNIKIGRTLVQMAIHEMTLGDADEVVLETEVTNKPALKLYEKLGFVRDKRLFRYYLNGVDALRLKLWLR